MVYCLMPIIKIKKMRELSNGTHMGYYHYALASEIILLFSNDYVETFPIGTKASSGSLMESSSYQSAL